MTPVGRPRLRFIISSQYFIYFGVLGLFLPYFNLYCYHLGFSGFQIGVLSAIRSLALVLFPLIWGLLADRFSIRKPIYILCTFLSTSIWALYLFYVDFWPMLAITAFYGIFGGGDHGCAGKGEEKLRTHTGVGLDQFYRHGAGAGENNRHLVS